MSQIATIVRQRVDRMLPNGKPSLGAAQRLVAESAYWFNHPSGRPVHAPKDYERITLGPHGMELPLGENKFLIGAAMVTCAEILIASFEVAEKSGQRPQAINIHRQMTTALARCFSGHNDHLYARGYPIKEGHFHCGSHSICAADFCSSMTRLLKLDGLMG